MTRNAGLFPLRVCYLKSSPSAQKATGRPVIRRVSGQSTEMAMNVFNVLGGFLIGLTDGQSAVAEPKRWGGPRALEAN